MFENIQITWRALKDALVEMGIFPRPPCQKLNTGEIRAQIAEEKKNEARQTLFAAIWLLGLLGIGILAVGSTGELMINFLDKLGTKNILACLLAATSPATIALVKASRSFSRCRKLSDLLTREETGEDKTKSDSKKLAASNDNNGKHHYTSPAIDYTTSGNSFIGIGEEKTSSFEPEVTINTLPSSHLEDFDQE